MNAKVKMFEYGDNSVDHFAMTAMDISLTVMMILAHHVVKWGRIALKGTMQAISHHLHKQWTWR